MSAPIEPVEYINFKPGCSNEGCRCWLPGWPCDTYEGVPETDGWCPCCGWHRLHHQGETLVQCQARVKA